jgi:hypothetical protein
MPAAPPRSGSLLAALVRRGALSLSSDGDTSGAGGPSGGASRRAELRAAVLRAPRELQDIIREFGRNPALMAQEIANFREAATRGAVPDGGRVLTKDEAARFDAYEALGVSPADAKARLAERDTLLTDKQQREATEQREALFVETAAAFGWNEQAARKAARALPFAGATLERAEDEFDDGRGGKAKKPVAYVVTGEGAARKRERLDAVMQRDHDLLMPALRAGAESTTGSTGYTPPGGAAAPVLPPAPPTLGVRDTVSQDVELSAKRRVYAAF